MNSLSHIKNEKLLKYFSLAVLKEREAISEVISYLCHIWERKLYAKLGYSSLFNFLIEKHQYSKASAYRRIQAAKLVHREPRVLEYLKSAKLNLTTLGMIEPYAMGEKQDFLIQAALGKTKEDVEALLVSFSHKVDSHRDKIRRLPILKAGSAAELKSVELKQKAPSLEVNPQETKTETRQKASVIPREESVIPRECGGSTYSTTSESKAEIRRVKIEFVANESVAGKIERAKQILRHKYPKGKLEDIFNEALDLLLEKKDPLQKIAKQKKKEGLTSQSQSISKNTPQAIRSNSRYIPKAIQREVYTRDQARCSYKSLEGKQCGERNFLELDHIHPFSLGGASTSENLRLLCRTHNQYRNQTLYFQSDPRTSLKF